MSEEQQSTQSPVAETFYVIVPKETLVGKIASKVEAVSLAEEKVSVNAEGCAGGVYILKAEALVRLRPREVEVTQLSEPKES